MERVVTVSGDAVAEPGNFRVPFGINQQELVEAAGGFKTEPEKLISGGPMMGFSMFSLDVPVTKTSSSILGFTKDEVAKRWIPSACINCGRCVEACPSRLIHRDWRIMQNIMTKRSLQNTKDSNVWNVVPAVSYVRQNVR